MKRMITKKMRDSFKAPNVAISYLANMVDGKLVKTIKKKQRILILRRTVK